jgi:hypothetical protein
MEEKEGGSTRRRAERPGVKTENLPVRRPRLSLSPTACPTVIGTKATAALLRPTVDVSIVARKLSVTEKLVAA